MHYTQGNAAVWAETILLPTYGVAKADKNPMFLEKRVYQGSSGKVYPLPVVDKILDEKTDQPYTAVWLENDYLRVMVLPELGGRIQRALDKTNGYDFVYYNEVIKPALVGLTGPWISGGIEFNWPQHHRPTTYGPTDWRITQGEDGSASVELSEVDQMYGTKGKMTFTLYPDKAYIEIKGQLYNRTSLPQTFLWWANPAVAVNDNTQSVFPPDVTAVFDHGKRDVSTFPIATGVYYKHDYGAGVDISRYRNIPVPTSYMCAHSDYNFVGGYDYGVGAPKQNYLPRGVICLVTASVAMDMRQSGTARIISFRNVVSVAPEVSTSSTTRICLPRSLSGRTMRNSSSTFSQRSRAPRRACEGLLRMRRAARVSTFVPRLSAMPSARYVDWL